MPPNYSRIREGHAGADKQFKGPEDRVAELKALRAQVEKRPSEHGYDPTMQLQAIDHEIARLTPPKGGFKQPIPGSPEETALRRR